MNNPLLAVLFQTEMWATRLLFQECATLAYEQFTRPLGHGPGSLERTLAHLVGALMFFTDRLNRTSARPRPDRDSRIYTASELFELFEKAEPEFMAAVTRALDTHALTDILNWTNSDEGEIDPADKITYAVAFAQMVDHGIHHRAQAVEMLRMLGVAKPLNWHPFEWEETTRIKK